METYDHVIIGAGIYGLYAANRLSKHHDSSVLIVEMDEECFSRASYVNQARVHNGYHYPRSFETAYRAKECYDKFVKDFDLSINNGFDHIYALSAYESMTNAEQYEDVCNKLSIPLEEVDRSELFVPNHIEKAYKTRECSFDYKIIRNTLLDNNAFDVKLGTYIKKVEIDGDYYILDLSDGSRVKCSGVFNMTYASINQINKLFGHDLAGSKYELYELVLCKPPRGLKDLAITVMDGRFLSIMPFGLSGNYSMTSVSYSPHMTSWDPLPKFICQLDNKDCTPDKLQNCNTCHVRPKTAFNKFHDLAEHYLIDPHIEYVDSCFAMKIVSKYAENDDARLVDVQIHNRSPLFASVFSGKIGGIYELDELLEDLL